MKTTEFQDYMGTVTTTGQGMSAEEIDRVQFVRQRFNYMADSRSTVETRWQKIKDLYVVFENHLTAGESWNTPYRFAELFGAVQRKFSDVVDNMPEVKLRSSKSSSQNFAIAQQSTLEHTDRLANTVREKSRVLFDSILYGTGILFEGYVKNEREITEVTDEHELKRGKRRKAVIYEGLCSERVDPRDFFIDETTSIFYDETGLSGARDCARRRIYPWSTFQRRFKGYKHAESVVPASWGSDSMGWGKVVYPEEATGTKTVQKYVNVTEYWNIELDMVCLVANGVEIYYGAIPFKHKRLPFTLYYNYRRDDSVWGISEAEILAPFILSKEELTNLQIFDAKLALQPGMAVSGDIMFNSEESELQPGAIFLLRGLNGGKVADAITPLRFGGIPQESFELLNKIEDQQITVTGDDTRALFANPNELATQTNTKREISQKRLRSNVMQNTIDSEKQRVQLRLSNLVQFYACPYQTMDGKVEFRRVKVDGYSVMQQDDESAPEFKQAYGAQGYFTLNEKTLGDINEIEIEVVDAQLDGALKKDELEQMLLFLRTTMEIAPINPQVLQGMDLKSLLKQISRKLDLDYQELFPIPGDEEGDTVDLELELVQLGITPEIDPNQDPLKALDRYIGFQSTKAYTEGTPKVKQALSKLISLTAQNVPTYLQGKLNKRRAATSPPSTGADIQPGMEDAGGSNQPGTGQSTPQAVGNQLPAPGAAAPPTAQIRPQAMGL